MARNCLLLGPFTNHKEPHEIIQVVSEKKPENVDEWTVSYGQWSLWYIMDFSDVRFSGRVHTGICCTK